MSRFIGRESQLATLRSFVDDPSVSRVTAIYGRRRIGKTRLVREAYVDFPVLAFEGLEGEGSAQQKKHFLKTLYRHSGRPEHKLVASGDWEDLLILLADYVRQKECVIFFDEFQWMAAERTELVSKLKYVWDNYFAVHGGVHLVLCGSVSSFLVKKVVRSKALYGRIDTIIQLGPLSFGEVRNGFFAKRSSREALEYYLVMGGVPKYLEMYDQSRSVRLNLLTLCFSPDCYFLNEFERLFVSHFGTVTHYRKIVEFLAARRFATRPEIAAHLGIKSGGRITSFLENLCLAGFIEAYGPLHNPSASRLQRYRIRDPYLRFYFKFIRPLANRITSAVQALPAHQALPDRQYDIYLGLAFEHFSYQHAHLLAEKLGFGAVAFEYGAWFSQGDLASGAQIDLLFNRADHVLTLCEVKFRKKLGREVIDEVEKKVDALRQRAGNTKTVEKVLVSVFAPAQEIYDEGYFSRILCMDELIGS